MLKRHRWISGPGAGSCATVWLLVSLIFPCAAATDLSQFTDYTAGQYQVIVQSGRPLGRDVNSFMNLMLQQYSKFFANWDRKAPARVVVFDNPAAFHDYIGDSIGLIHAGLTGICHQKSDGNGGQYFELVTFQNDYLYRVLAHEGFHQFIWYELGSAAPVWFNEGMAQYFQTSYVIHGQLKLGDISRPTLQAAQAIVHSEKGPTIEQLIRMDRQTFYQNARVTYPLAWALCYYLMHHDASGYRESAMKKYVADLKLDRDPVDSFATRFGRNPRDLQYDFSTYVLRLKARFD